MYGQRNSLPLVFALKESHPPQSTNPRPGWQSTYGVGVPSKKEGGQKIKIPIGWWLVEWMYHGVFQQKFILQELDIIRKSWCRRPKQCFNYTYCVIISSWSVKPVMQYPTVVRCNLYSETATIVKNCLEKKTSTPDWDWQGGETRYLVSGRLSPLCRIATSLSPVAGMC